MSSPAREIRQALREKLGVGASAISNRVRRIMDQVPMAPEEALYVLAHKEGVRLDKFLGADDLARVAQRVSMYEQIVAAPNDVGTTSTPQRARKSSRKTKEPTTRNVILEVSGLKYDDVPGFVGDLAERATTASEIAYPLLHMFENMVRELIRRVLSSELGNKWWEEVPKGVRDTATMYMENEHKEKWHTPRGDDPIEYVDLMHLTDIIVSRKLWPYFEPLFPNKNWVQASIRSMNVSRRIVAHMNVLPEGEVATIKVEFRKWAKTLRGHEDQIPY